MAVKFRPYSVTKLKLGIKYATRSSLQSRDIKIEKNVLKKLDRFPRTGAGAGASDRWSWLRG